MIIMVTGGAGFIGSNLIDRLLTIGNKVVCFDNFEPFYSPSIKSKNIKTASQNPAFSLFKGDIRNAEQVQDCFSIYKPEIVVHLAAKAGVRPSIDDPTGYYATNVIGTLNLLEEMKKNKVKKLIFASSSSVYGNNLNVPFTESDNVDFPISPYAASKKAGELLCHTYHHLYNFDIFCLRFFTVYGPRQRPDLAIHKFTNLIQNDQCIDIYGDGSSARDYTFINDTVEGIIKAIENLKGYDIFNIGESKVISLVKMIETIEKFLEKKAIKKFYPMQAGDVEITYANINKSREKIGYNPIWNFEDGIKEFLQWIK